MASESEHGRVLPSEDNKRVKSDYKELTKRETPIIYSFLENEYGIKESDLKDYVFIKRAEDVWVCSKRAANIVNLQNILVVNSIGFRAIRDPFENSPKITTNFAQYFGHYITKRKIELSDSDYIKYIMGEDLDNNDKLTGFYVMARKGKVIGIALASIGKLKNQLPKGRILKSLDIIKS